jgi:osmotically inducible protein OsmC
MVVRTAATQWLGDSKNGKGKVKLGSSELESTYTAGSRIEHTPGADPEELLGAEEAACFNKSFADVLDEAGYSVQAINTVARVHVDDVERERKIASIELDSEAKVMPDISEAILQEKAESAKYRCPVSPELSRTGLKLSIRHMPMAA